jgi:preprotein translocase subunit SecA
LRISQQGPLEDISQGDVMLEKIVRLVGGDPHQKILEGLALEVGEINTLESQFESLDDQALGDLTNQFRRRLAKGETLDDILPEAFTAVREASKRMIGQRHYDVQMIGGIAMHRCFVAEMRTGEGKTLGATLPLYLNALTLSEKWVDKARATWGENPDNWKFTPLGDLPVGRGVHLVTVNDYLARRDARWMAPIYNFLGLSVGVLQMAARTEHGKKAFLVNLENRSPQEDRDQLDMVFRKEAYQADILYGTNNEFGFDYLRDNMAMELDRRVQRGHHYAIIDEVDNVLIDEARTPLIISGPSHDDPEWYRRMATVVKRLVPEDYEINIRDRNITLTPLGEMHVEELLGQPLGDPDNPEDITPEQARLLGYLEQALRAEFIFKRNKDYLVQTGKVVIIDDFTGRLMPGRRWSDGLHQAVEAKENVKVQSENVTYATITIQNYFRMYEKLSGMTGTAVTESEEFNEIYNLDPIAIPTNLDFVAGLEETSLVTLTGKEPESGFEFTYYADKDDPEQMPLFWKRKDYSDRIYLSEEAKLRAIAEEIIRFHIMGRPLLVGTTSVENSERLSSRLDGPSIRTLLYTLMIRESWMRKHNRFPDGRRIPDLQPLNAPLDQLKLGSLRNLVKELELDLVLNVNDPENIQLLLEILELDDSYQERLVQVLKRGVGHDVLNARKHTEESQIIAGAGAFGAVMIATSMAGRGVDIKLGGELAEEITADVVRVLSRAGFEDPFELSLAEQEKLIRQLDKEEYGIYDTEINFFLQHMQNKERVKALGGLHVIGSERHEARRIDNQLRGRAARQGDPGSSRFYLSMEDELMARFGGQQMEVLMNRLQVDESMPITNPLVDRVVEQSQNRVEGANFDVRKHLLEYDDVLNQQRSKIYDQRDRVFLKSDLNEDILEMLRDEIQMRVTHTNWEGSDVADQSSPWRLLAWVTQIQPTLTFQDNQLPSFTIRLLLNEIRSQTPQMTADGILPILLDVGKKSLTAEEDYLLNAVDRIVEDRQFHYQDQLEMRFDTLDTFLEGLSYGSEEPLNQQEVFSELRELTRTRFELNPNQIKELIEGASPELEEEIRNQIQFQLELVEIKRLIGAVERLMGSSLEVDTKRINDLDWETAPDWLAERVKGHFQSRRQAYFNHPDDPRVIKSIEAGLKDMNSEVLTDSDLVKLLGFMAEGRQAAFDKKSHRRIWLRTQRLRYHFYAAELLAEKSPEELEDEILDHLESVRLGVRNVWGEIELGRLKDQKLADLEDDLRSLLLKELGEETGEIEIDQLQGDTRSKAREMLGNSVMNRIYRDLFLRVISELWVEYLTEMEALRVAIGLEAYAQRDPLVQYKSRGFEMFQQLMENMRVGVVSRMFTFQPRNLERIQAGIGDG